MPAPKLSLTQLRKLNPCAKRLRAMEKLLPRTARITASEARKKGASFNDIVWAATSVAKSDRDVERRLRMWMADCAARVLHIYEKTENSTAPREAIIAARRYANGEINSAALDGALDGALAAARAAWDGAWAAALAAARAALAAARAAWAAWAAALAAARAARAAAPAARDAAWDAARDEEEDWQFTRLCEWLSESEPEPLALPERQNAIAA